jgi:hypothetical protein
VDHNLAHARPGIETLDGHTVLQMCGADYLARGRALRHRVLAGAAEVGHAPRYGATVRVAFMLGWKRQ